MTQDDLTDLENTEALLNSVKTLPISPQLKNQLQAFAAIDIGYLKASLLMGDEALSQGDMEEAAKLLAFHSLHLSRELVKAALDQARAASLDLK